MVVLGLTFASLSFSDQEIARGNSEQEAAKIMAKSAVNRVIALLENNTTVTESDKIVSGGDPNNSNHYDFLWKMITYHGDVPGAGDMQSKLDERIKNGTNSPYWQYVVVPNKDGKDEIVGRFAYAAYQPAGLLDPYTSAKTKDEATTPVTRYGMSTDEIDLKALVDVAVPGGSGILTADDINTLGKNNADSTVSSDIGTPTALFERLSDGTKSSLNTNLQYVPLRNKLTASWFGVPRSPAQPERFAYKVSESSPEKYYHRFRLNRTPDQWKDITMDQLTLKFLKDPAITTPSIIEYNASADENVGSGIPWFSKDDDDTRQIAANFLAYFSPIPEKKEDLKKNKYWDAVDETAKYTANMRTPYINDLLMHVKLNMLVTDKIDGDADKDLQYKKIFTVEITPEIDVYIELADLYNKSLDNISSLTFKVKALEKLIAQRSSLEDARFEYYAGDMTAANENLKKFSFPVTLPLPKSEDEEGSEDKEVSNVFPVFRQTIKAANPFKTVITVPMTRQLEGSGYGAATCVPVAFTESLQSFVMDEISVLMSATFKDRTTEIPIDLANISKKKTIPVLGAIPSDDEASDDEASDKWAPFELDIDKYGNYDKDKQKTQERHIVLRYRAIDSAANLKQEHWVESDPQFLAEFTDITTLKHFPGLNNYAELKAEGLLTFNKKDELEYHTLTAKINGSNKTFFVDKEEDHSNIKAVEGYGAVVSTSYIRGQITFKDDETDLKTTEVQSPWEIGFIHRGAPYQTLNIKRFNKNSAEIGKYEDGDANIFDYIKVVQKEKDSEGKEYIPTENKVQSRGLVNLQKISHQNENSVNGGNLPAAYAFFSNINLGWKMDKNNNKFAPKPGIEWDDMLAQAKNIVKEIVKVVDKPDFELKSRAAILDPVLKLQSVLAVGDDDAAKEELIGRFIMLTTADSSSVNLFSDFLVVTAIAQRIQISSAVYPDKDWLGDGTFAAFPGNPSGKAQEAAWIEAGYGYRNYNDFWKFSKNDFVNAVMKPSEADLSATDRKLKFYPGYDKILSTQKVIAWLRKNSNGKWYIERLDYVD